MGGQGSGNWIPRPGAMPTVEKTHAVDVSLLRRSGALCPEGHALVALTYEDGAAYELRASRRSVSVDGVAMADLEWVPCAFGGERPWLLCPTCGRRTVRLHIICGELQCRSCAGLVYVSTRWDSAQRKLERARKIRAQLGGSGRLLDPFPPRPKHMRRRTYLDMRCAAAELAHKAFLEHLGEGR